jgi:hypothetical protein
MPLKNTNATSAKDSLAGLRAGNGTTTDGCNASTAPVENRMHFTTCGAKAGPDKTWYAVLQSSPSGVPGCVAGFVSYVS